MSVADPALAPEMMTGVVDPKLAAGRFAAPDGPALTLAVMTTLPVNPLLGVTVMREVLAEVEPAETVKELPLTVNVACGSAITVTVLDPLPEL